MRTHIRSFAAIAIVALVGAACGQEGSEGPTITVGSANFAESTILAEIYAQVLEAEGYEVDRKLNIGSREVYFPALERGEIDLLPEYTGALVRFLTKDETSATSDSQETYQRVSAELEERDLVALDFSDAQDKDAIVVTKETADRLNLSKVSDLAPHASGLVFGGSPECPTRPSCLKGLREVYELEFKEVKTLDVAGPTTIAALEGGEVDVSLLFTTQGIIADKGFVVLDDDKGIEVAQNIFPAVRSEIVDAYGDELVDLIDSITAKLTTEGLTELNKRADVDKDDPDDIAGSWARDNGFV